MQFTNFRLFGILYIYTAAFSDINVIRIYANNVRLKDCICSQHIMTIEHEFEHIMTTTRERHKEHIRHTYVERTIHSVNIIMICCSWCCSSQTKCNRMPKLDRCISQNIIYTYVYVHVSFNVLCVVFGN